MRLDRSRRQREPLCDLRVRQPSSGQLNHVRLARRELDGGVINPFDLRQLPRKGHARKGAGVSLR